MKYIKKAMVILLLLVVANQTVHAALQTTAYNWYFKKVDNNAQPPDCPEINFIEKYNGKWIDREVDENDKVIYLTFDAGYENGNIEKVLNILKEKEIKGTFFILENLVKRNPQLVQRMNDEGHTIGNHTCKHPDMSAITDKTMFKKQIVGLEELCEKELGITISKYFRPPQGRFSKMCMSYLDSMGYKTVFWSFAYADWDNNKQPDPEKSIENILAHTHNGMVLLLHPTSSTNARILPTLIDKWKEMGYRFGSADELFE